MYNNTLCIISQYFLHNYLLQLSESKGQKADEAVFVSPVCGKAKEKSRTFL